LNGVDEPGVVPRARLEELLDVAGRDAGVGGQGFGRLSLQVREQPPGIVAEVNDPLPVVEEPLKVA